MLAARSDGSVSKRTEDILLTKKINKYLKKKTLTPQRSTWPVFKVKEKPLKLTFAVTGDTNIFVIVVPGVFLSYLL